MPRLLPSAAVHSFRFIRASALAIIMLLAVGLGMVVSGSGAGPSGALAQEPDLVSPAQQTSHFQASDTSCPPGSLPAPPPPVPGEDEPETVECAVVVDRREATKVPFDSPEPAGHFASAPQYTDSQRGIAPQGGPIPNPGIFDAGTLYDTNVLAPEESATFRAYLEVYPEYTAEEFDSESVSGYYMTATNRMAHGIEFLARFRESNLDPDEEKSWFMIYDWSCVPEFPCDNGYPGGSGGNAFVRAWRMDEVPCWYSMSADGNPPDAHFTNRTYYRNSTWIIEERNPPTEPHLWRNAVSVWNWCTGQYDGIYSHDYAINPDDCSFTCMSAHWAGVAERFFDSSEKPPVITKQGFSQQTLDYDGQSTRLRPWNSSFIDPSTTQPEWEVYYLWENDAWGAGTKLDNDGDNIPNDLDPDIDGDGVLNEDEIACGTTAPPGYSPEAHPYRQPERVDGPFAGVDDDGDTLVDEALPAGVEDFDCDGDGFTGAAENHVYSYLGQTDGDQRVCQQYDTNFPDPNQSATPSKGWPADLVNGSFGSDINIQDMGSFIAPVRYMNTNTGSNPGDVRWDLIPGSTFGAEINIQDMGALVIGATGHPPMFGGERAFNGPDCPWPE